MMSIIVIRVYRFNIERSHRGQKHNEYQEVTRNKHIQCARSLFILSKINPLVLHYVEVDIRVAVYPN